MTQQVSSREYQYRPRGIPGSYNSLFTLTINVGDGCTPLKGHNTQHSGGKGQSCSN